MPLIAPIIDDRRYDDIITEVRTRIARYTPEWAPWTDVNDSDPGIALTQVFAWLTEMLIYRMGKVPELNYIKFLQLLGIELRARQPAQAEIAFGVAENHGKPYVIVPPRAQVSGESPQGGRPVVFETERALWALTARLRAVQAFDGYAFHDVTAENNESLQGYQPFGPLAQPTAALYLGFRYPDAYPGAKDELPQIELNLAVTVASEGAAAGVVQCGLPDTRAFASAKLRWEGWNGASWQRVDVLKDETLAFTRSGHVYLKTPAPRVLKPETFGQVADAMFWIRALLESSAYERPPELRTVRTNTTAARQAETVRDEVLGGSNGRRDQTFQLANAPVLPESLRLEVDEGDSYVEWTQVDDLVGSRSSDRHYTLNPTTGEVTFGDGENGRIPVGNVANPGANVVAREYRFGGGAQGNLPAGALKTLVSAVAGIDGNAVGNLFAAYSGREEEALEDAKKRARQTIRSRCRAVTAEDYESLAQQAGNVKRAKALPLFHPSFPDVRVPGVVTVIVVPDSDAGAPMPSEGTLRTVCAFLDQRRLLTAELYVTRPVYQHVEVEGEVVVNDDADPGEVKTGIENALTQYFHPLRGGDDGEGWPFGGPIFYSKVYQRVFTVAGVQSITRLVIRLDGRAGEECRDVPIRANALLYSTEHHVDAHYRFDEDASA
ncbi:MAG: putative baseplate assembly protein [Candidatus Rokubacteria bacterium]|nr:putative baseplate assembly protein [Candidatus Rokubacteria bacterium]